MSTLSALRERSKRTKRVWKRPSSWSTVIRAHCCRGIRAYGSCVERTPTAALKWILRCLIDVAGALQHMHSLGMVHGDLKCNNILLQSSRSEARGFRCKIADMGCSRLLSTPRDAILTGTYGAQSYAAPELLKEGSLSQVWLVFHCYPRYTSIEHVNSRKVLSGEALLELK